MDISTVEARRNFAEIINRAAYGKERVALKRRRKIIAYVVPVDDVRALEAIEDEIDAEVARKALEDLRAGRETARPFEEAIADIERKRKVRKRKAG